MNQSTIVCYRKSLILSRTSFTRLISSVVLAIVNSVATTTFKGNNKLYYELSDY